ncbi:16S rRNA (cytosine(967)-C(5))-methyltransferase RsmB [Caloramator sp. E03]|uniref:16S rRNA (cytosine(967)-C(5))-methyltransferase RsmB n=1 Tax=Caloramator sp. E03 TaxID=2576307 RepID=UPI001110F197|nr:16S rRNA (cytosine(967)-C(5))-methyltransferase RsmB [Caloramator sp. E03]QCX32219.1 16S rRNA (cytosine(967)-C(5))-methyltransferase RsmB [Caloramator sp. E03]
MEDKARLIAVKTLCDIDEKKSYSNIKLNYYFKKYDLSTIDRTFSTEILYGTIRWKLKIDYLISKFAKKGINNIPNWVLNSIRIAVYQIFFMDRVPEFAAVDQSVEIVKYKVPKAASFTNAILRNILRNKDEFNNIDVKDKFKKLSIQYSHPEWFVKRVIKETGEDFAIELMNKNNTPSDLTIRVNSLKISKKELTNALRSKKVEVYEGRLDESLILKGYSNIEKSEEFSKGYFIIQDEASMLATKILDPKPFETIIDLCSAPGGKSTHIAQLMENKGEILAFDIYDHKLKLVNENAKRLGIDIIKTQLRDSTLYYKDLEQKGDRVLIDAPCSGLGLIRKKPEIRWNTNEDDIKQLIKIQKNILNNAARYVKVNGVLLYSTCTITREENEEVIDDFLKNNNNYELKDICSYLPLEFKNDSCKNGFVKLYPNLNNCDGFFIAKLIRKW